MAKTQDKLWNWCGVILGEDGLTQYRGVVVFKTVDTTPTTVFSFSDGLNSYVGSSTQESICLSVAECYPDITMEAGLKRVKAVFDTLNNKSGAIGAVRIAKETSSGDGSVVASYALHISAFWGTEYGVNDVLLDIAKASLQKSPTTRKFLQEALLMLRESRRVLTEVKTEAKAISIEVEDLIAAQEYFADMQSKAQKEKRLQACTDILNEYKMFCRERAPK